MATERTSLGVVHDLDEMSNAEKLALLRDLESKVDRFSERKFWSPGQLAPVVKVSRDRIRKMIREGDIKATKNRAGRWEIPAAEAKKIKSIRRSTGGGALPNNAKLIVYMPWRHIKSFCNWLKTHGLNVREHMRYYNKPGPGSVRPDLSDYDK